MTELTPEQRNAIFIDLVAEVSELIDQCYKKILSDEDFETPDFEGLINKRNLNEEECELFTNLFTEPFSEIIELSEGDDSLKEKYSFLNDKQVKKLAKLLDALVVASVSKYTDQQPEFQELKENMKKLVENEKEKAQQEEQ
jgi:hypothetical protein